MAFMRGEVLVPARLSIYLFVAVQVECACRVFAPDGRGKDGEKFLLAAYSNTNVDADPKWWSLAIQAG